MESQHVAAGRSFGKQYVAAGALLALSAIAVVAWFANDRFGSSTTDSSVASGSQSVASPSTGESTTATTRPVATTSATTAPATTTPATTAATSTSGTSTSETRIRETTTTSIDPLFVGSPRAFIDSPLDESLIAADLQVLGSASYRDGVDGVRLVIRREQDQKYWHDSTRSFESEWIRFALPVSPSGANDVSWSYTVDAEDLPPGRYFVRVWAIGSDANDPVSDQRHFVVAD